MLHGQALANSMGGNALEAGNFRVKKSCVRDVFCLFHTCHKKCRFFLLQNLMYARRMLIRKRRNFCSNFFDISKCFSGDRAYAPMCRIEFL
jgi:hypothetical protein